MANCPWCGALLDDQNSCRCGNHPAAAAADLPQSTVAPPPPDPDIDFDLPEPAEAQGINTLRVAAWVCAFALWPVGLALAIIGDANGKKMSGPLIVSIGMALFTVLVIIGSLVAAAGNPDAHALGHLVEHFRVA